MHYLEKELRELIAKDDKVFRFIEEGSLDGLWYWDLENPEHEWMNNSFWETLGVDPATKDHLASEWQSLIHPKDLATAIENLENHKNDPDVPYDQYVRYKNAKIGGWAWVRCRGLIIRDEKNRPIRMLGAHIDVTQILKELNVALTMFTYAASHDLQAPVRNITGLVSFIEEDLSLGHFDELAQNVGLLRKATKTLQRLIDCLLVLARMRNTTPAFINTDLLPMIKEVWTEVHQENHPIKCDLVVDAYDSNHRFDVDPDMILLFFRNVLQNCFKYSYPGRDLRITVSTGDNSISISDNGVGMTAEQCLKATDVFVRLNSSGSGSGLGLSIVKDIVNAHDAQLEILPNEPEGITVTIFFK